MRSSGEQLCAPKYAAELAIVTRSTPILHFQLPFGFTLVTLRDGDHRRMSEVFHRRGRWRVRGQFVNIEEDHAA